MSPRTCLALLLAPLLLAGPALAQFTDVTSGTMYGKGITDRTAIWGDPDGDGDPDLYVGTAGDTTRYYRNDGGGVFTEATAPPLDVAADVRGMLFLDFDGDDLLDLVVTRNSGTTLLLRNEGGGSFSSHGTLSISNPQGIAAADYDGDGDLDLLVAAYSNGTFLFANDGAGGFTDVTGASGMATGFRSRGVAWGDYDGDGDPDFLTVGSTVSGVCALNRNNGDGTFTEVAADSIGIQEDAFACAWGDYDDDGDLDVYLGSNSASFSRLLRNDGGDLFTDVTGGAPLQKRTLAATFIDYDNDGDLDLYQTTFGSNRLLRNDGAGTFVEVSSGPLEDSADQRDAAWADYDGDGDLDVFVATEAGADSSRLLRNDLANGNHWLEIDLRSECTNRFGIGALVRVVTDSVDIVRHLGAGNAFLGQDWSTLHFGLGGSTVIDSVIVTWPGGATQVVSPVPSLDTRVTISQAVTFSDIAGAAGTQGGESTRGMAWGDYDGDGDPDLFVSSSTTHRLYRNDGGNAFTEVTPAALASSNAGAGAAWADFDNDGLLDLAVADISGGTRLWRQGAPLSFTDVSASAGLTGAGLAVVWGDYDGDGDVDLYHVKNGANQLLRNDGDSTFVDVAGVVGVADGGNGLNAAWGDSDGDGDLDLFVSNDATDRLFRNDGGAFIEIGAEAGVAFSGDSRGCAWGDYDGDGDLDLAVVGNGSPNRLYRNDGGNTFLDVANSLGLDVSGNTPGVAWVDYDNDGHLDLHVSGLGSADLLFRNDGVGGFDEVAVAAGVANPGSGTGVAWADMDGDGDLDAGVGRFYSQTNLLWENLAPVDCNAWLHLDLEGTMSNRSAIGARVRVEANGQSQVRVVEGGGGHWSQNDFTLEFGLGDAASVDLVEITWPSGCVQVLDPVPAVNTRTTVVEPAVFLDVASAAGVAAGNQQVRGISWGDYDNDGDPDAYVTFNGVANRLYRNNGDGSFTDVAGDLGVADAGTGAGSTWGDYDNDGDLDLFLCNFASNTNRLYRNDGGSFTEIAAAAGVQSSVLGVGCAWVDYDGDGDLDLHVLDDITADHLFRNDGGDTFVDVAATVGVDHGPESINALWQDFDQDGDPDFFLAVEGLPNALYENNGGVFTDIAGAAGLADAGGTHGAAWGDYDRDGDADLVIANTVGFVLYRNDGSSTFTDVTATAGMGTALTFTYNVAWIDFDNDGDLDLHGTDFNASTDAFFRNDGGVFTGIGAAAGMADGDAGAAWADFDGDGDLDGLASGWGTPQILYENGCGQDNAWLQFDLIGVTSNRSAIGARVRVVAGGVSLEREVEGSSGHLSQPSLTQEFGLGALAEADTVEIVWPSGTVQTLVGVAANQRLTVRELAGVVTAVGDDEAPVRPVLAAFPNPFRADTRISFSLAERGPVQLGVYDVTGRLLRRLENGILDPGVHETPWDGRTDSGRRLASGVYFYALRTNDRTEVKRVVLLGN